jgi:hypothetical protein
VLAVEADLTTRLAARAAGVGDLDPAPAIDVGATGLDPGQAAAVAALTGRQRLVVVEGAAGAGKTTTLAATRNLLHQQGCQLLVLTPTLKAAKVAAAEVGAATGSAAWLAYQHGWRWNADGVWTRLAPGQADPVTGHIYAGPPAEARLRPGDLLVVDEAGMLDQTPPAPCSPSPTSAGCGWRCSATGTNSPRSAGAASSTSPPPGSPRSHTRRSRRCTASPAPTPAAPPFLTLPTPS